MVMVLEISGIGKSAKNGSEDGNSRVGSVQDPQDPSITAPNDSIPQIMVRGAPERRQRFGVDSRVATRSIEIIFSQLGGHRRFSDARTGRFSMVHPVQDMSQNEQKTDKFHKNCQILNPRAFLERHMYPHPFGHFYE